MKLATIKRRSDFLRIRGGARCPTPSFVLECKDREPGTQAPSGPRFGFTVTRALGCAVDRNKIRRRLKAAVGRLAETYARSGVDYIVIARRSAIDREFADIEKDLERAFQRVHHPTGSKDRSSSSR